MTNNLIHNTEFFMKYFGSCKKGRNEMLQSSKVMGIAKKKDRKNPQGGGGGGGRGD